LLYYHDRVRKRQFGAVKVKNEVLAKAMGRASQPKQVGLIGRQLASAGFLKNWRRVRGVEFSIPM
jgi:hypothetical protein